jgi:sugar lactone lactonase YvrE
MKWRTEAPRVELSAVATFPNNYFLENLAVRADNSVLVTVLNHNELWYVPSSNDGQPVEPRLLFTFPHHAMGIVEVEPDVFYISASDIETWRESHLYRLDLNGWAPGQAVHPESVLRFPPPIRGLNGSCAVAPGIILLADSWAGLIWRVDLHVADGKPTASVWLKHDSMDHLAKLYYQQIQLPGINGVQYSPKREYLYYTASAKRLFMRVKVDPISFNPVGEVEVVGSGRFDDFWIDQDAGFAYLAGHTLNTIDRLALEPSENGSETPSVAGNPFNDALIGPSAGHWGRGVEEYGRVAFVTTDGGTATPPAGGVRPAKVMKAQFIPETNH